jgi:benzoyl-CoA reductase/2-hydroxyglutaryl-CoA dehydratase subunit BcrC/BadD/HgdB
VSATTALTELTEAFEHTFARLGQDAESDRSIVVTSWPSVPMEVIRAAGLRPVVARGSATATPTADAQLESDIFPSRLRHLIEAALTGRLSHVARIVVPRTSDPDYKGFLYLREFVRTSVAQPLAPSVLFDLLQSNSPDVRTYNAARTRALIDELASVSGAVPSHDDLRRVVANANAARAAARRLIALRRGVPRIAGRDVFPLLGAFWQMAPEHYAALAGEAADEIETRPPLTGPRLLLTGAPVDGSALHAAIESHGAIVVAEVSPWGSGVAGNDVAVDEDVMDALTEKYRAESIGARMPIDELRRVIERSLDDIDAVVVSLPPEDSVFGWDYPVLRDALEARRIPYVCLRGDPYQPLTAPDHSRLEAMVAAAARAQEARHG